MSLFITTQDLSTKDLLLSEGFELVEDSSNRWVFINNRGKFATTKADVSKITETDRVCV